MIAPRGMRDYTIAIVVRRKQAGSSYLLADPEIFDYVVRATSLVRARKEAKRIHRAADKS